MAVTSKLITAIVAIGSVALLYVASGQDVSATVGMVASDWSRFILAVQIVAAFLLGCLKHYLAGGILVVSSLLTLFGVIG